MSLPPVEELTFIHELPLSLRRISTGFNLACPLCGEGSSRNKKRGYILLAGPKYERNTYVCHNCYPEGMSLRRFISLVDDYAYQRYRKLEKEFFLKEIRAGKPLKQKKSGHINSHTEKLGDCKYIFTPSQSTFIPARAHKPAVEYCKSRNIPEEWINRLLYCPRKGVGFGEMLIFPLYFDEEQLYGFQGRSLEGKRFHTFMPNDSYKVFNFFEIDRERPVYVLESIIDSFSLPNSIAMLGADLSKAVRTELDRPIFCFDNDRTGMEKTKKYLEDGETCFIWPAQIQAKDFNKLSERGIPGWKLLKMVKMNTMKGLQGIMEINARLSKTKKTFRRTF